MKTRYSLAILATAFVMVLLFSKDKKSKIKESAVKQAEVAVEAKSPVISSMTAATAVSTDQNLPVVEVGAEKRQISEVVQKKFSIHLKSLAKCLKLAEPSVSEKTEPTSELLLANLRTSFGDMVVQMDDWSQTEFLDQGAVKKRVRVDYDYPDGTNPTRRLSMYQINSYGMPEIMNLTADEVNNPNEAYVTSLYEGRKVVTEENGARVYFPDGEELIFSVRNGLLQSVSLNKGDHSFNCFNLDEENSSCTCP